MLGVRVGLGLGLGSRVVLGVVQPGWDRYLTKSAKTES